MNNAETEGRKADRQKSGGFSRRTFLKGLGTTAVTAVAAQTAAVAEEIEKANAEKIIGPGAVPVALTVNRQKLKLMLEPRVTLLDALRNYGSLTGAKEGCDRAACGACTVHLDGVPIYSCQKLAIEAQGHAITTIEGLAPDGELSPLQKAFVEKDALQCGYCTPGFVMSATALLANNPRPSPEEIKHGCAGNLCRCGTHPHIVSAILQAAGIDQQNKTMVVNYVDLADEQ
jgi:aerobic-type carbon monoxide dehydrogenase small subunit (CoxS/CutS family)